MCYLCEINLRNGDGHLREWLACHQLNVTVVAIRPTVEDKWRPVGALWTGPAVLEHAHARVQWKGLLPKGNEPLLAEKLLVDVRVALQE